MQPLLLQQSSCTATHSTTESEIATYQLVFISKSKRTHKPPCRADSICSVYIALHTDGKRHRKSVALTQDVQLSGRTVLTSRQMQQMMPQRRPCRQQRRQRQLSQSRPDRRGHIEGCGLRELYISSQARKPKHISLCNQFLGDKLHTIAHTRMTTGS